MPEGIYPPFWGETFCWGAICCENSCCCRAERFMSGGLPPNINLSALQQQLFSQQMAPQHNVSPQNGGYMPSGIPGLHGGGNEALNEDFPGAGRKRGPLPSQQDSLIEEQRRGNWRNAR